MAPLGYRIGAGQLHRHLEVLALLFIFRTAGVTWRRDCCATGQVLGDDVLSLAIMGVSAMATRFEWATS